MSVPIELSVHFPTLAELCVNPAFARKHEFESACTRWLRTEAEEAEDAGTVLVGDEFEVEGSERAIGVRYVFAGEDECGVVEAADVEEESGHHARQASESVEKQDVIVLSRH